MKITDLISERLVETLSGCGMFRDDIFSIEKMIGADRMYLDISTDGQSISYITKDRLTRFGAEFNEDCTAWTGGDFWNEEFRRKFAIKTRPGRVIQAIYGTELPYSDQRKLRFMLFDASNYEVKIMTGDDIAKYYNADNYAEARGDLYGSCMSHCPSSFFELYKKYCKLAVVMNKTSQKIAARAVVYEGVRSGDEYNDINAFGRIYSNDDIFYDMLLNYAFENEYHVFNGGYGATKLMFGHGENDHVLVRDYKPYFPLDAYVFDEFNVHPYVDNFEYAVKYIKNGEERYAIATHYTYPNESSYRTYDSLHSTQGGDHVSWSTDYCEDCSFPCSDCWKNNHGGWEDGGDDDDYYDEWDD